MQRRVRDVRWEAKGALAGLKAVIEKELEMEGEVDMGRLVGGNRRATVRDKDGKARIKVLRCISI